MVGVVSLIINGSLWKFFKKVTKPEKMSSQALFNFEQENIREWVSNFVRACRSGSVLTKLNLLRNLKVSPIS
jgi:hypothetical protein